MSVTWSDDELAEARDEIERRDWTLRRDEAYAEALTAIEDGVGVTLNGKILHTRLDCQALVAAAESRDQFDPRGSVPRRPDDDDLRLCGHCSRRRGEVRGDG